MPRLLMIIFTENFNIGASVLCSYAIEHGWIADIHFITPNIKDYSQTETFIKNYNPDLISFSFKSFEREQAIHLANIIRNSLGTNTKMIAGGIHPTLMHHDTKQSNLFDAIIIGDGLGIWTDVLNRYKELNNEMIYGKHHSNKDLYTKYFYSSSQIERMKLTKTATILTSIGCPYNCSFCHSGSKDFFSLPIENVAKHIIELNNKYEVQNFHFLDDLFASNIKRLHKLREIIEQSDSKLPINFSSQVSAKANNLSREIAEELVKLGVETVNIGIETASPKLIKFLNKKQTIEDCYNAVQICHDLELNCVINLLFGIPTQDKEDYELTIEFIKNSKPDSVNTFFYTPYPGTELYNYCFEYKYLPESFDRNKFDWFKPSTKGTSEIQVKLNNVDYDLAIHYIEKIKQILNQDDYLFKRMELIDNYPWILIGTTRHYYYITLIKKLSSRKWKNFCGYINVDKESGFYLDDTIFFENNENINKKPLLSVTYLFLGSDFKLIEQYAKNNLNTPLISVSSFKKSHSTENINEIIKASILCRQ